MALSDSRFFPSFYIGYPSLFIHENRTGSPLTCRHWTTFVQVSSSAIDALSLAEARLDFLASRLKHSVDRFECR